MYKLCPPEKNRSFWAAVQRQLTSLRFPKRCTIRHRTFTTFVDHQFITLSVDVCVQHGGLEAPRRAGLSAAAETCDFYCMQAVVKVKEIN